VAGMAFACWSAVAALRAGSSAGTAVDVDNRPTLGDRAVTR
jgi:hypothetical protein